MTKKEIVNSIADRAGQLAQTTADQTAAFREERDAEIAILTRVLDLIRPILPSLCQPLEAGQPTRGVRLDFGPPNNRLVLLADGTFCDRSSGAPHQLTVLALEDVIEGWDPEDVIAHLAMLMTKQAIGRKNSAADATKNAAKLKAILTLLES